MQSDTDLVIGPPARSAGVWRRLLIVAVLATGLLSAAACTPAAPAAPAAEEATVEATAAATDAATDAAAEATEEAAEEAAAEATEAPTEEATAEATEEATEEAAEEATEEPAEEGAAAGAVASIGDPARGGYIFAATAGCGCHFNRDLSAPAGGNKFEGPFGVVYASNITSDPETGIGNWTDEEIVDALRLGVHPDGTQLHPIMPYIDWSVMSDQDAYDMAAALRTLPPVVNAVPENELLNPVPAFAPAAAPAAVAPAEGIERGAYLVALGRCGSCHTPKTDTGAPDSTRLLAGATVMDEIAPNLTPDESAGLGGVPDDEIVHFLMTGEYEDGSLVEGPMKRVIDNGTSQLTEEDVRAIVAYLRSIPAVADAGQ